MPTVRLENLTDQIRLLTLDRPERLNAMSHELVADVHAALDEVADDRAARVLIITGAGRGFCSGLDLKGTGPAPGSEGLGRPQAGLTGQQHIARLVPHLRSLRIPVIAAVNGPAAGGGFALALASDVRVASASARFNVAFVRIGLSGCDIGVSWLLPRLIGASRAHELMLTGRLIDAAEADRIGLVSRVVPDGEVQGPSGPLSGVVAAAVEIAEEICANSPFGVWMTKEVMWSNLETGSMQAAIDLENRTQILTSYSRDADEAARAFRDRRSPSFLDA
jgi:enoyl-CoA hydratase